MGGDKVACLGVSEPGGGSDVAAATTTARRVGDDLVINGQKMWITNAFQADWMCLLANTREGNPHRNKSLICLPMDTPGIHLAKKIDKMGMKCSDEEHHWRGGYGLHIPDDAIPGGKAGSISHQP